MQNLTVCKNVELLLTFEISKKNNSKKILILIKQLIYSEKELFGILLHDYSTK